MSLRPATLMYIMQMGTGEGQRVTVFCKNKELLCCIELHNGGKSLPLSTILLKSISAPKGAISYIFNRCFVIYIHVSHCILLQKQL